MYVSNQTQEPGLPPAPMIEILDNEGSMYAGHYYFALLQDYLEPRSGFGFSKGATTGPISGMMALGPATHVKVDTPWNTVRISDIPIDFERQYARIFMSTDSIHFYQIAVAPAISTREYYDMSEYTYVTGEQQTSGLFRVTIVNPAQMFRENVGTMITRDANIQPTNPFTVDFQNIYPTNHMTTYKTANIPPSMSAYQITERIQSTNISHPKTIPECKTCNGVGECTTV
jgi:hypothetical protein